MIINTKFILTLKKNIKIKKIRLYFIKASCVKAIRVIENLIDNFLIEKNSFIFESVEKRRIRGRYTIIGAVILIKFGSLIKKKYM